jgi:hypothetical protein
VHLSHKSLYVRVQLLAQLLVAAKYLVYVLVGGGEGGQVERGDLGRGIGEGGLAELGQVEGRQSKGGGGVLVGGGSHDVDGREV